MIKKSYMTRTVTVFLDIAVEEQARLAATVQSYAQCFEAHAAWAQEHQSTNVNTAHRDLYQQLRDRFPDLPAAMIQCARNHAFGAIKSYNSNNPMKKWRKQLHYRARSMKYDRRTVTMNSNGALTFSLSGGKRCKTHAQIPRFFSDRYGTWQFNAASIGINAQGRVFANLNYRTVAPDMRTGGEVVGIDRGIYNIATTSNGRNFSSAAVRGRKRQLQHTRRTLQAQSATGSRSAKRRLHAQREKGARFSKNELDIITASLAADNTVCAYVLEDLSGLYQRHHSSKKFRKLRNTWSPAVFEAQLRYKCERNGIAVVSVDPRYTSQECSSCGHIERSNRKGAVFCCQRCGFSTHADRNAAYVIRQRYLSSQPAAS